MTAIHSLVIDKKPGSAWLQARCGCRGWHYLDTDGDRITTEYRAHKARASKGEQ